MADDANKPASGAGAGFGAAIELALARTADYGGAALVPARQLGLLPEAEGEPSSTASEGQGAGKPGRPEGARNKRTEEWTSFILANYRSPLIFLAETYSRPAKVLAAEIGCDVDEALKIQVDAAKNLAPYVHQKQPMAVQVDSRGIVRLVIEDPNAPNTGEGLGDGGEAPLLEAKVIQGDSE